MFCSSNGRPLITSYDSAYEHSLEHYIETRRLVAEADKNTEAPLASGKHEDIYIAIRSRAYELFEHRGRQHGSDLDDWLIAEQKVLAHFSANSFPG